MDKIAMIAGIGLKHVSYGGEVIKNKNLLNYLKTKVDSSKLFVVDTFNWQRNLFTVILKILFVLFHPKYKIIILSCFTRGAYYFLKAYRISSIFVKKDIHYFIVGGSLPEYVEKNKVNISYYRNKKMYAESNNIRDRLLALGMKNISAIPNWKSYTYTPEMNLKSNNTETKIKAFFYSRICPEKGTEIIFNALDKINSTSIKIEVDFYGEIQKDYSEAFNNKVTKKAYCRYNGLIDMTNEENYKILSQYDCLLFPTYYVGEGIAGAVIDSMIAGVPVLASDWNFNKDIVEHMRTGLIYEAKNVDAFHDALVYLLNNKNVIQEMRFNCIEKAKDFKIENLLKDFILQLN